MSTEIDELKKRVAALEKSLAGWIATELARNPLNAMRAAESAPGSNPIPANEGDSRLAESVAIPVGWVACGQTAIGPGKYREHGGQWIKPDPSIPWGEGYEAILPEGSTNGEEVWERFDFGEWKKHSSAIAKIMANKRDFAWRRRIPATTPTEPARDLSAEGERLEAELRAANHRADIAENEEVYSLRRSGERMKLALERIASVDARDGSEYVIICAMRKTAREALG